LGLGGCGFGAISVNCWRFSSPGASRSRRVNSGQVFCIFWFGQ
jgi:hypothetical protein